MDDLIGRQDAIDAVHVNYDKILDFKSTGRTVADSIEDIINALPSAQPERKNEPAGCNGCRYDWFGDPRCAKCSRSFQDHYEAEREEE